MHYDLDRAATLAGGFREPCSWSALEVLSCMKTREEIQRQRDMLAVIAAAESPVPFSVRVHAQDLCHTLTWVLNDDVSIFPYNIVAGCCCIGRDYERGEAGCAIGIDMCLGPSRDDICPQIPPQDRPRGLYWAALPAASTNPPSPTAGLAETSAPTETGTPQKGKP